MLDKLIPWKKRKEDNVSRLSVRHDDPITELRRDFEELLSRFWGHNRLEHFDNNSLLRPVDFDEDEKAFTLIAELPGFEPSDIDIKVTGKVLTIRAEHTEETNNQNGRMHRYGSFYESFSLPPNVNVDQIDARYRSGVLEVQIPKDQSSPAKHIHVKAA